MTMYIRQLKYAIIYASILIKIEEDKIEDNVPDQQDQRDYVSYNVSLAYNPSEILSPNHFEQNLSKRPKKLAIFRKHQTIF